METNGMTPEKSLQIISDAIARSRKDFERNSGTPMVLWGVTLLAFSLITWLLLRSTENPLWNFLWFGVPAVGWLLSRICLKDKGINGAKSIINETIGEIWIGYGIFATVIALILAFIAPQQIGTILIALLGYGTFMTGMILKNGYITAGGLITGIGGVAGLLLIQNYDSVLIFTAASFSSLILPGIMMNRKAKKD